jgi:hypothetical protein
MMSDTYLWVVSVRECTLDAVRRIDSEANCWVCLYVNEECGRPFFGGM